jgi:putative two-component system response regulator
MGHAQTLMDPPDTTLPAASDSAQVAQPLWETHSTSKIMMVDDEPINIKVICKLLKMAGYTNFTTTTDPTQAIELIRGEKPDVLLLDIVMPKVSGMEILRRLSADPALMRMPVIILTATSDLETKHQALLLGATDFLNKPADFTELFARVRNALAAKAYHDRLADHAEELERQVQERTAELTISRREAIQCLARAAECRSDLTSQHSARVSAYSGIIARAIGLDEQTAESIELAALLHDVGKIGLPDSVLKHVDRLSLEELDLLKKHGVASPKSAPRMLLEEETTFKSHTLAGARIMAVGKSRVLELAATIAMSHHEKWDGSGYPLGLRGASIPLEGRIVAVANALDLLSTAHGGRAPFPEEECFAIMADGSGTHFDPDVVQVLLQKWREMHQVGDSHAAPTEAQRTPETMEMLAPDLIPCAPLQSRRP